MSTDQATHATPQALGSTEGLGQEPERNQPTNAADAAAGNENAIRHIAYAEGYAAGKAYEREQRISTAIAHGAKFPELTARADLEREIERLRAALQRISTWPHTHDEHLIALRNIARNALWPNGLVTGCRRQSG